METLRGKYALVTGGSRGIGAAIVRKLASEGAAVAFTYQKSKEKAEKLASEIRETGGIAHAVSADASRPEELEAALSETANRFGRIDILVNNAGIGVFKPLETQTLKDYEETMAVNVRAVFVASVGVVKYMPKGSRIITIGSNIADATFGPQTTLYTMSKSALQGLTRGLAWDLGEKRITVNLVQPGPVDTDMNPDGTDLAKFIKTRLPFGEYGKGEDVAGLVAFLAAGTGDFVNGSVLTIDGGFNA